MRVPKRPFSLPTREFNEGVRNRIVGHSFDPLLRPVQLRDLWRSMSGIGNSLLVVICASHDDKKGLGMVGRPVWPSVPNLPLVGEKYWPGDMRAIFFI